MDNRYRNAAAELAPLAAVVFASMTLYWGDFDESTVLVLYAGSMILVLTLILSTFDNLIFAARLFLLFIVGAYPLAIKLMGRDLYFSVFEFTTQTLSVATTMYALSLLAVVGAYLGWKAGAGVRGANGSEPQLPVFDEYHFWVFALSALFAVLSGVLITASSTGTILDSAYGSGTEGSPIIGSASAIGGIALSVMFYCCMAARRQAYWILLGLVAAYLLAWCQILRGLRQDVVGAVFSCLVLFLMFRLRDVSIKVRYILYVVPVFLALELWGLVRTGLSLFLEGRLSVQELLDMGLGNAAIMPGVVYSGTLGPIATTFANVVALFERGQVNMLYGSGYVDYLLRTPPEFLYPDRPQDYALMFPAYGLSSGGGFFELAEAYLNFGLLGALVVPFLISFVIANFYSKALSRKNIFYIFALSSILCVWLRGSWYQTFAFYKSFISGLAIFMVIHVVAVLMTSNRRQRH